MGDVCKVITNFEITKTNAFQEFLKGLIRYYSNDLGEEIFMIFNYFWMNFKKVIKALIKEIEENNYCCSCKKTN